MVAHFTIRTYRVNQAFGYMERVVKFDFFSRKRPTLHHTCAKLNEQPSNIKTMASGIFECDFYARFLL